MFDRDLTCISVLSIWVFLYEGRKELIQKNYNEIRLEVHVSILKEERIKSIGLVVCCRGYFFQASMESAKTQQVKKAKKKQVKDELDRMKQAERKRRRLEKALATSAAIRSELEKKKQLKKEEQQKLDKEGAAIAEAVALHVLIEEDSDQFFETITRNDVEDYNTWHCASNTDIFVECSGLGYNAQSHDDLTMCSYQNASRIPSSFSHDSRWNGYGDSDSSSSSCSLDRSFYWYGMEDVGRPHADISAELIAAQVVSSLQINDNDQVDAVFFNGI